MQPISAGMAALSVAAVAAVLWFVPPSQPARTVTAVAFSADGQFLVAAERHGRVSGYRVPSWQKVVDFRIPESGLNTVSFSSDSRLLATAGRSLRVWNTADWSSAFVLDASGRVYGTARFDFNRTLATVNAAEQIELWDVTTRKVVRTLCCMALYGDLAFSPDSRLLAAAGHRPRLWDSATGREVRRLVKTRNPTFAAVAFRADGKTLATGSQDGRARIWDVSTGLELLASKPRRNYIETVAFHPDGRPVAYGIRDGPVWLWDTATGAELQLADLVSSNVAFSVDGHWLGFAGAHAEIHVWSIPDMLEAARIANE